MVSKAVQAQRVNYHYMADAMRMLEWDLHQSVLAGLRIPDEWHRIARQKDSSKKTRVTLRLDDDVVRFCRSMGPDWQVRINRIIAVWMHARLAGLIEGPETMDYLRRGSEDEAFEDQRPHWGDDLSLSQREMLERTYGEARAEQMRDDEGVPVTEERKPSAVLKAEFMAMKARRGD
ncbi:BrnA antitoxin family protein [Paracoccus tegillarcae]|uniref:BrnA antitoxin of type II toxin-antitoxin system n=1 Tax=Paracoccus tegillarcae TaxID=1529068 RepID=A0A2K9EM94_9RHOB|nr:BrnA antitoxin family protein [Paracoccus tegillarcae]AUH32725.1 hypothetical protein CUV01_04420 [Paracoccus tegillarcae]